MTTNFLDACPHCGQAGFVRVKRWPWEKEGEPGLVWGYHVICDASGIDTHPRGCGASSGWGETPEEAIAAWNRRAYGAVEALADCIALLDALAESALKDDDTATWAMCSVMADKHRPVLVTLKGDTP